MKFLTPNLYKSNQDECNKLTQLSDHLPMQDGQFDLLPLIGESKMAAYQNVNSSTAKHMTQTSSPNKFDNANGDEHKSGQDPNIQCT